MIVVLTGAGISQESGLATFRASGGLWEQERIEDVATPQGFARNPTKVYNFYNTLRKRLRQPDTTPNAAHLALAKLEAEGTEPILVVTQNVDDLHERAGTQNVLHMHGELLKARCTACSHIHPWQTDFDATTTCPYCKEKGYLRPHIVWFEEMPLYMNAITSALSQCRLFVSIGTSGNVYPAAGFASEAKAYGAKLLELNLEPSKGTSLFDDGRYGPASIVVSEWVTELLAEQKSSK